jgi:hypothetical protein
MSVFGGGLPSVDAMDALGIKAKETGIRNGWFMFPYNYDPVWMEGECNGYEPD